MAWQLHQGDCIEVLRTIASESVDACVTDPPYELGFMGKGWDKTGIANSVEVWREVLRVLKPGGHLLAFSGTRTYHRMVCAIEDAGFEIRDQIGWLYGSGFPKSLDVSKAIDKRAGAVRKIIGTKRGVRGADGTGHEKAMPGKATGIKQVGCDVPITAPVTQSATDWQGWGTALKPAWEPIVLARKPLSEPDGRKNTVAENVLKHGTGGINVDGCRVNGAPPSVPQPSFSREMTAGFGASNGRNGEMSHASGRWPANVIHDGSPEVLAEFAKFGESKGASSNGVSARTYSAPKRRAFQGDYRLRHVFGHDERGTAARFFYCAKASKKDRDESGPDGRIKNNHPTVKPTALMRYLCKLVTPPKGIVLDPFTGSGSTGKAALLEGFSFIGIERDPEYLKISKARIKAAENTERRTPNAECRTLQERERPPARVSRCFSVGMFAQRHA